MHQFSSAQVFENALGYFLQRAEYADTLIRDRFEFRRVEGIELLVQDANGNGIRDIALVVLKLVEKDGVLQDVQVWHDDTFLKQQLRFSGKALK